MRNSGKAPTFVVWVISLVLYIVALASYFGLVPLGHRAKGVLRATPGARATGRCECRVSALKGDLPKRI